MRCPHANYVVQKALTSLRHDQLNFIVDELTSKGPTGIVQAARHKYGCRIIQRLLEHGSQAQAERVVDALLADAVGNCLHAYGNYAMQKILQYGTPCRRRALVDALGRHAATLGADANGSSVLAKALSCCTREEQIALLRAMLAAPGLLLQMSRSSRGSTPARVALKLLEGDELEEARRQLSSRPEQHERGLRQRPRAPGQ